MLIASYRHHLTLAGYRPRTVQARIRCVSAFAAGLPGSVQEATRFDVEAYLSRGLKAESRRAYRSHLRCFYAWLVEEVLLGADPTLRVPAIRVPRRVPHPIPDADLALALQVAKPRMRAWLLLMALAGLRCVEVSNLRPRDLTPNGDGHQMFLRECKGGGEATVPAHPLIVAALSGLAVRNGLWWSTSANQVSHDVAKFLASTGSRATAHHLRHFAGTTWYRVSGHDLLATAALLRHANVQSTQIYAAIELARPAEVVNLVTLPERPEAA